MAKPYNQIVLFGDSLFEFSSKVQDGFSFQGALQGRCMRGLDVINRGFSGYSTKNALQLLPQVFLPPSTTNPRIECLLVLLGANDAALPIPTNAQHVPIEQYKENLISILTHEHITAHKPKILLVTPPPIDQLRLTELDLAYGHQEVTRQAAVSAAYSEACRNAASAVPGVVLIDLQKAILEKASAMTPDFDTTGPPLGYPQGKRGALEQLLPDGLHMSGEAYKLFFDIVIGHIEPFLNKSPVYPLWREANPGSL